MVDSKKMPVDCVVSLHSSCTFKYWLTMSLGVVDSWCSWCSPAYLAQGTKTRYLSAPDRVSSKAIAHVQQATHHAHARKPSFWHVWKAERVVCRADNAAPCLMSRGRALRR